MNEGKRSAQAVEEDLKLRRVAGRAAARYSVHGVAVGVHELKVHVVVFTHEGDVLLQHAEELGACVVHHRRLPHVPSVQVHEHSREHEAVDVANERTREVEASGGARSSAGVIDPRGVNRRTPAGAEDVGQGEEALTVHPADSGHTRRSEVQALEDERVSDAEALVKLAGGAEGPMVRGTARGQRGTELDPVLESGHEGAGRVTDGHVVAVEALDLVSVLRWSEATWPDEGHDWSPRGATRERESKLPRVRGSEVAATGAVQRLRGGHQVGEGQLIRPTDAHGGTGVVEEPRVTGAQHQVA